MLTIYDQNLTTLPIVIGHYAVTAEDLDGTKLTVEDELEVFSEGGTFDVGNGMTSEEQVQWKLFQRLLPEDYSGSFFENYKGEGITFNNKLHECIGFVSMGRC